MSTHDGVAANADPERDDHPREPQQRILRMAYRMYKMTLSPVMHAVSPSQCVYLPTCSEYAYTAVSRFGIVRGPWLALRRLGRCTPWSKGGLDPVPEKSRPAAASSPRGADRLS
jgi:putative membrane protein insertion efficiency factor